MPQVTSEELVAAAIAGQVVSFPTDTVPALAVRPEQSALIFQVKGRSLAKPLILMGANLADLWSYVAGSERERVIWQAIAQHYLPGALTLVLPASSQVPLAMNPLETGTIGIRIPNHPTAQHILTQTGCLATTSANRSGEPPLESMTAIASAFPEISVLSVDNLSLPEQQGSGKPSTVVKWTGQNWQVLRQGAVNFVN
jgi:L-threonylcarbamoyladenylate synthase